MSWTENCHLRCGCCGKFMSYNNPNSDQYTPFGSYHDSEPPDEVDMCSSCSKEDELYMIKQGYIHTHWRPSKADRRAAKVLGFAEAGPKGAAWSHWFKKGEPLPKDYVWWNEHTPD